jgi:mono/diheme cytochrome c family protein
LEQTRVIQALATPAAVGGLMVLVALATGSTAGGARDRTHLLTATAEQVARGRTVFETHCAKCHGPRGEGTSDAPRLIGQPNGLVGYQTAKGLFDFASSDMPFDSPGTLKPEEYWDVLAFILDGNGLIGPDVTLGPDTAEGVRLGP